MPFASINNALHHLSFAKGGALVLSNCRLLRNCFEEIFKDASREAGIWFLEVR